MLSHPQFSKWVYEKETSNEEKRIYNPRIYIRDSQQRKTKVKVYTE
jgi:hypothetical protein